MTKTAAPAEELRQFVDMSRRVGLLLGRFKQSKLWTHLPAKQVEMLRELEAEAGELNSLMDSLKDEEAWEKPIAEFREMLATVTKTVEERMSALTSEGA